MVPSEERVTMLEFLSVEVWTTTDLDLKLKWPAGQSTKLVSSSIWDWVNESMLNLGVRILMGLRRSSLTEKPGPRPLLISKAPGMLASSDDWTTSCMFQTLPSFSYRFLRLSSSPVTTLAKLSMTKHSLIGLQVSIILPSVVPSQKMLLLRWLTQSPGFLFYLGLLHEQKGSEHQKCSAQIEEHYLCADQTPYVPQGRKVQTYHEN